VTAALFVLGCGAEATPPPVAPATEVTAPTAQLQTESKQTRESPTRAQISISDEIQKACGLTDEDAYFAFDSAQVGSNDRDVLTKVAKCFANGALAGKRMKLVGHADPRGESEYNLVLGGKRADSVKRYISSRGLNDQRIETSSRGAFDATGRDEGTWAKDRRVDVMVAN
jgi:peptidoglycan-associated lipoprotein